MKQAWYEGGTWPNPLTTGVVSMSFTSTRDFRLKFCKMVVKNRNSSMRARPSPAHIRFPIIAKRRKKGKRFVPESSVNRHGNYTVVNELFSMWIEDTI